MQFGPCFVCIAFFPLLPRQCVRSYRGRFCKICLRLKHIGESMTGIHCDKICGPARARKSERKDMELAVAANSTCIGPVQCIAQIALKVCMANPCQASSWTDGSRPFFTDCGASGKGSVGPDQSISFPSSRGYTIEPGVARVNSTCFFV